MKLHATKLHAACIVLSTIVASAACAPADDSIDIESTGGQQTELETCGAVLSVIRATASADDGNVPGNAIDGKLDTRWSALGKGSFLTLDLGATKPLCSVAVAWYRGDVRRSSYAVSSSTDGLSYTRLASGMSSGTTTGLETIALPSTATGRYLRITVDGNTENDWASISETAIRTTATTGTPAPTSSSAAPVFDGTSGYVEIGDDDAYSQVTRRGLTVEAWLRPDSLSMPRREGSGYVHWMGKGQAGAHEWTTRMYQAGNSEDRANRISFYHFNPSGGLGAGSYFQDPVRVGEWIHVVGTIDASTIRIYKNGSLRDSDPLSGYSIVPQNTTSSVRIATRDFNSFFQGAIARVAIYSAPLSESRIRAHYDARGSDYDSVILGEPTLVGYWRLAETSGTVAVDSTGRRNGTYRGGTALGRATWAP